MDIRFRSSKDGMNIYAHLWLDFEILHSYDGVYPNDFYCEILEDMGDYLEVRPVGEYNPYGEFICPDCRRKHTERKSDVSWYIAKKAIVAARVEDKE